MGRAKRILRQQVRSFQQKRRYFSGVLGDPAGRVRIDGRENYVYVRIAGKGVVEALNNTVSPFYDLPVVVGYPDESLKVLQIISLDYKASLGTERSDVTPPGRSNVPLHHKTHEWGGEGGGNDPVFSDLRQLMPLRPTPITGSTVHVYRNIVYLDGEWMGASGEYVDLSDYIPDTGSKYALLYLSTGGFVDVSTGDLKDLDTLTIQDIPDPIPGTIPIAAIRLYGDQEDIQEAKTNTDVVDLRWINRYFNFEDMTISGTLELYSDFNVDASGAAEDDYLRYVGGQWIATTGSASGGGGDLEVALDDVLIGTRPRINLHSGANVYIEVSDDAGDDEVDITINAVASSGSGDNSSGTISYRLTEPLTIGSYRQYVLAEQILIETGSYVTIEENGILALL